ncbi:ABC transporter permease [Clostridium isatidis]|uniref:ABC-2 type transporter transmembrane domain-containing protein n=1 Tax=Clostridium isatidis TaxID=182773 RepID=A0A343JAB7_9CLOT|nr:ABC transporter permease [Clostridium isatidis]ASW42475.1 hypothetical protein BEN51_02965 [Clostridium isatidis]
MIPIIKATILECTRDRKNLMFMVFFPLFLIALLGSVLTAIFSQGNDNLLTEETYIYYVLEDSGKAKEILDIFINNLEKEKEIKLIFKKIEDLETGKTKVQVNKDILLHFKGDTINVYSNDEDLIKSSYIYGILSGLSNRLNSTMEVYKINPIKASEIINREDKNYIEEEKVKVSESPSAMNYYGVAEIGLMIFYFINYPLATIKHQRKYSLKNRISLSGISTFKYYLSLFIAFFLFSFSCVTITYLLSKFILNINYGSNPIIFLLAVMPFLIIVNGIGIIIPAIFKEEEISGSIISNIIIPALTFLGGGYVALGDDIGGMFNIITNISPLRWFNKSLFRYIYSGDFSILRLWLIIGVVFLIVFILVISIIGRRSDKIYEKYPSIN